MAQSTFESSIQSTIFTEGASVVGYLPCAQSTGSPCSECALHGRDCIIDEFADKRRKVARDRVEEELAYYRGFLEQLLEAIRHGNRADIDAIINVIRSGASEKEIRLAVARLLDLEPTVLDRKEQDGVSVNSSPGVKSPDGVSVNSSSDVQSPDGVSAGPSPGLKKPDGVSVNSSADSGLSAILNNDP
ncbi:hypothetical protein CDV55_104401 [Aspergillus turcosus]|nr:hypothetical protein CDV55_104401 [Aspergillus turcosus]